MNLPLAFLVVLVCSVSGAARRWLDCMDKEEGTEIDSEMSPFVYTCVKNNPTFSGCRILNKKTLKPEVIKPNNIGLVFGKDYQYIGFVKECIEDEENVYTKTLGCWVKGDDEKDVKEFKVGSTEKINIVEWGVKRTFNVECFYDKIDEKICLEVREIKGEDLVMPANSSESSSPSPGPNYQDDLNDN
ncbi:unnamed protein product, partial [Mesorhabditis belari]|uniref:Uncharacterized protein n=1 Tax=Mesorhabditis belari TaxID=2138241 RepID=A0AAF3EZZ0_9BILA